MSFFGRISQSGLFTQIATFPGVASGSAQTTAWSPLKTGLRYEWYATVSDGSTTTTSATRTFNTAAGTDPVLVGAGDIADCNSTGDDATGALVTGVAGNVFTHGRQRVHERHGRRSSRTATTRRGAARPRPARGRPGNHDWNTGNLNGYFGYFGAPAGRDPATRRTTATTSAPFWHVVVLDSDCARVTGGCARARRRCSGCQRPGRQLRAGTSSRCGTTRASAPAPTNFTDVQPFVDALYAAHADLILLGHDHIYERFGLHGPTGAADPNGIRHITVGTGGVEPSRVGTVRANSEVRNASTYGVLQARAAPDELRLGVLPDRRLQLHRLRQQSIVGANSPPSATVVLTPTAAPSTNDVLTATATKSDPDGDPVSLTWEWRVNGVLRRTFTSGSALADTFDLSQAGNGNAGDTVTVTVTPSRRHAHRHAGQRASLDDHTPPTSAAGLHDRPDRPDPGRGRHRRARRERHRPRGRHPDLRRDRACPRASPSIPHRRHQRSARLDDGRHLRRHRHGLGRLPPPTPTRSGSRSRTPTTRRSSRPTCSTGPTPRAPRSARRRRDRRRQRHADLQRHGPAGRHHDHLRQRRDQRHPGRQASAGVYNVTSRSPTAPRARHRRHVHLDGRRPRIRRLPPRPACGAGPRTARSRSSGRPTPSRTSRATACTARPRRRADHGQRARRRERC